MTNAEPSNSVGIEPRNVNERRLHAFSRQVSHSCTVETRNTLATQKTEVTSVNSKTDLPAIGATTAEVFNAPFRNHELTSPKRALQMLMLAAIVPDRPRTSDQKDCRYERAAPYPVERLTIADIGHCEV